MVRYGEIARVWFLGDDQNEKRRRAVVLDLYPDAKPLVAVVIVGMGFAKDRVHSACVDPRFDRQAYELLECEKTTYFNEDDIRYYDVNEVAGMGVRCPPKLFEKLKAMYNARLDRGAAIPFNVNPPRVPEPAPEVISAAAEQRYSQLVSLDAPIDPPSSGSDPAK